MSTDREIGFCSGCSSKMAIIMFVLLCMFGAFSTAGEHTASANTVPAYPMVNSTEFDAPPPPPPPPPPAAASSQSLPSPPPPSTTTTSIFAASATAP